jgi:regulator of protease activity HflC (stomatin/prohibitin superfamily)
MSKLTAILMAVTLFLLSAGVWPQEPAEEMRVLEPGKRFDVSAGIHGTWEFTQRPQIGMVILKIQLFDDQGEKISPLTISGRSDMPSMAGHHDSGDVPLKLNKSRNYLLPVNVVMPGDWEVQLTFRDGERIVLRARIPFDV